MSLSQIPVNHNLLNLALEIPKWKKASIIELKLGNQSFEEKKADFCHENPNHGCSEYFCFHCELQLCKKCDSQIHSFRSFRKHERILSKELIPICRIHKKPLTHFCETHDEILCSKCKSLEHKNSDLCVIRETKQVFSDREHLKLDTISEFRSIFQSLKILIRDRGEFISSDSKSIAKYLTLELAQVENISYQIRDLEELSCTDLLFLDKLCSLRTSLESSTMNLERTVKCLYDFLIDPSIGFPCFPGELVDCMDRCYVWCVAKILQVDRDKMLITYVGWKSMYDEWIPIKSSRIAPFRTHTTGDTSVEAYKSLPRHNPQQ
jgi:hypothetical protein